MIVLLVGTNHEHQLIGYKDGETQVFGSYLSSLCDSEYIDLLAEELNEEAIELWKAQDSIARRLAVERKIDHIFCDPDSSERRALGILTYEELRTKSNYGRVLTNEQDECLKRDEKSYWPKREDFWLRKIQANSPSRCLFVLGSNHVQSFSTLLSSHGISAEVKTCKWKP